MKTIHKIVIYTSIFSLQGCALFNPYIETPKITTDTTKNDLPQLTDAINQVEKIRENVAYKRWETTASHTGLNLLVFGAAAGSGISALYGASRDLVLALGLGAVGSYAGNNLFFNDVKSTLYNKADQALGCVTTNAYSVIGIDEVLKELTVENFDKKYQNQADCTFDSDTQNAKDEYDLQIKNIKRFNSQDTAAKQQTLSASRKIIYQLNEELKKNEPSPEAILNAANSIGPLGMAYLKNPTTTDNGKKPLFTPPTPPTVCINTESYRLNLISTSQKIKENLNKAQSAIDDISSCELKSLPAKAALETDVVGGTIDLKKGDIKTIHIKGGDGFINLVPQWIGNIPPTEQINVQPIPPRTLVIVGGEKLIAGSTYNFSITDSSQTSNPLTITIKTK